MAKVRCEYCGDYILDTEERCPHCGAVNFNHTRTAKDTPTTIQELQSWYKARNLPPEETTRFFIGKDVKEPRAFGIYKDSYGDFVVYKNKSNGQRAIRYKGNDEAYAINEIYLKLKEEILNQKSRNVANINKQAIASSRQSSVRSRQYDSDYNAPKRRRRSNLVSSTVFTVVICSLILPMLLFALAGLSMFGLFDSMNSCYYLKDGEVYYYDWEYCDWWAYNKESKEWKVVLDLDEDEYLDGLGKEHEVQYAYTTITEELGLTWEDVDIARSRAYIDAGHHKPPTSGHYVHNDNLYYYLDDIYAEYGIRDNSGWYRYNQDSSDWEYYGDYDDRSLFNDDEIWYNPDQFYGGEKDLYDEYKDAYYWDQSSFTSTTWYQGYLDNEAAYDNYIEDRDNDWDDDYDWNNDSDYDWDDDYDWDSGDTDWDSDW